jgi:hypothetical protein
LSISRGVSGPIGGDSSRAANQISARPLGWFVAFAFAVSILVVAFQDIVLHLRVRYPMSQTDSYFGDVARRPTPWASLWDAAMADVTIFLHSALMIAFWLVISVLLWGLFVSRRGVRPEK